MPHPLDAIDIEDESGADHHDSSLLR